VAGAGKGIFGFFDEIYGIKCGKLPIRKCASSSHLLLLFLSAQGGLNQNRGRRSGIGKPGEFAAHPML
jgi:hypothetical protein